MDAKQINLKNVVAWGMYDLGNTAFSALFVTFFFPFYLKEFLHGTEFHVGLVFGGSMALVALVVPFIGAWSDRLGRRMPFVIFFTLMACLYTWLVARVNLVGAILSGFLANFAYHSALTTYNAMLPELGSKKNFGYISGLGTALGYVGTLISLGLAALILNRLGWESRAGTLAMFSLTAFFYLGFSLITFVGLREPPLPSSRKLVTVVETFRAVGHTLKGIGVQRGLLTYLFGMFFYTNAVTAVIVFLFLFGRTVIGLSVQSFMAVFALFALASIGGALLFGRLTDRLGARKALLIAGWLWILVVGVLLFVANEPMFVAAGILGGIALGAVWTTSRPLLVKLAPQKKVGEFFGYSELAGKLSGIIGPIVFGALAAHVSYTAALLSVIVFFIVGILGIRAVPQGL
jgi:UMF1 family MFS transporter